MTPRQIFFKLEKQQGRQVPLLRVLFLATNMKGMADEDIVDDDDAENFYYGVAGLLQIFWEKALNASDDRLVGMEGFTSKEVIAEVNRVLALLKDFLDDEFETDLPEKKLNISTVH